MLNNIVDNIEQRGQHNIVQGCFLQAPKRYFVFMRVSVISLKGGSNPRSRRKALALTVASPKLSYLHIHSNTSIIPA